MGGGGALGVEFWAAMGLSPRALLRLVPQPGLWASSLLSSGGGRGGEMAPRAGNMWRPVYWKGPGSDSASWPKTRRGGGAAQP